MRKNFRQLGCRKIFFFKFYFTVTFTFPCNSK